VGSAEDPDGYLTAVGDEDFLERARGAGLLLPEPLDAVECQLELAAFKALEQVPVNRSAGCAGPGDVHAEVGGPRLDLLVGVRSERATIGVRERYEHGVGCS
jgi:hypothetical protein